MNELTKDALRKLIEDYGVAILEDPDRLSQFLEDGYPAGRDENFRVSFALRCLLKFGWTPRGRLTPAAAAQYSAKLSESLGFSAQEAEDVMEILRDVTTPLRAESASEGEDDAVIAHPGNLRRITGGISNKPRTMWLRKKSLYNGLILIVSLIVIAVLFLQIGNQRNPVGDEFRIAFFAPMSGASGHLSHNQLRGAQLAVQIINKQGGVRGYKLRIVGYDVPADKARAEAAVRRAMQDRSILVMMTGTGGSSMEMMRDVADEMNVPLVITAPEIAAGALIQEERPSLYAFHTANDTNARAKALAYFARQGLAKKRFALLCASDVPSSSLTHEALLRWIKIFDGEVLADLSFRMKEGAPQPSVYQALEASGADLAVLTGKGLQTAEIISQARSAGLAMPILAEGYITSYPDEAGNALAGSWWVNELSSLDPQIRSLLKEFKNLYNENCQPEDVEAAVLACDGVMWVAHALWQAPGYRGEAIRHALLATRNFPMTHATLTIDPRTHGPLNKAMSIIFCASEKGIFQKRIRPGRGE